MYTLPLSFIPMNVEKLCNIFKIAGLKGKNYVSFPSESFKKIL